MNPAEREAREDAADDVLPGLDVASLPPSRPGQTAALLQRALDAATHLVDDDQAMIGAARAGAFALDQAMIGRGPKVAYAVAAVLSPYAEVLARLGLSPVDERGGDGPATGAAAFLAELANPTPPTPPS